MIPSESAPSSTSVSERIMPSDVTPRRSARPSFVPSGSTAPGSATSTTSPAATFGAPQTIVRMSEPASCTLQTCSRSASGCCSALSTLPIRKRARVAVAGGDADARDPLELGAAQRQRRPTSSAARPGSQYSLQPGVGDLHQNCSRKRRSFSKKSRRSGMPCLSIAIRSMPMPNAKPCTRSGS